MLRTQKDGSIELAWTLHRDIQTQEHVIQVGIVYVVRRFLKLGKILNDQAIILIANPIHG